jgi:hypothetical protein
MSKYGDLRKFSLKYGEFVIFFFKNSFVSFACSFFGHQVMKFSHKKNLKYWPSILILFVLLNKENVCKM